MKEQNYIYTIWEERSFSGAAKKLFVSQPALSMTVKKVEEELGITIFDRSTTPLSLTGEGEVYIAAVEQLRSVERSLHDRLADMANLRAGSLSVSGENFVSSFILPEILMKFSAKYAGISVDLTESNSPNLRQMLLNDSIDLLVAHDFDPALYEAEELFEEKIYLAVPESFPINDSLSAFAMTAKQMGTGKTAPAVDLSLFGEETFLLLKPGNDMCRRAFSLYREAGFDPKPLIHLDQLITAYNLCRAGMGITFVTDVLVQKASGSGCLYYALKSDFAKRTMSIGYKKNRYLSRAALAFIETAKEVYGKNRQINKSFCK